MFSLSLFDVLRPSTKGVLRGNRRGKVYPQQSARQALRVYRRAHGGPGLTEGMNPQPRYLMDPHLHAKLKENWLYRRGARPDPYRERAAEIFKCAYEEVTPAQRTYAKQMMYVEIYGRKS